MLPTTTWAAGTFFKEERKDNTYPGKNVYFVVLDDDLMQANRKIFPK